MMIKMAARRGHWPRWQTSLAMKRTICLYLLVVCCCCKHVQSHLDGEEQALDQPKQALTSQSRQYKLADESDGQALFLSMKIFLERIASRSSFGLDSRPTPAAMRDYKIDSSRRALHQQSTSFTQKIADIIPSVSRLMLYRPWNNGKTNAKDNNNANVNSNDNRPGVDGNQMNEASRKRNQTQTSNIRIRHSNIFDRWNNGGKGGSKRRQPKGFKVSKVKGASKITKGSQWYYSKGNKGVKGSKVLSDNNWGFDFVYGGANFGKGDFGISKGSSKHRKVHRHKHMKMMSMTMTMMVSGPMASAGRPPERPPSTPVRRPTRQPTSKTGTTARPTPRVMAPPTGPDTIDPTRSSSLDTLAPSLMM